MRYFCLACICLFFLISCKSNYTKAGGKDSNYIPYYLKVYEADSLYLVGDYERSYYILDSLFAKFEPLNMTLYFEYENYVKSSVILAKESDYTRQVSMLIKKFGYNYQDIEIDSLLNVAWVNSKVSKIKASKMHESYVSSVDTVFRNMLHKMNIEDQLVRNNGSSDNIIRKTTTRHDSIIKKYIFNYGYPSDKKIGTFRKLYDRESQKNLGLAVLLNHLSNTEAYEFYLTKLLVYVKDGSCPPKDYAQMVDRHYTHTYNSTYYHFIPSSFDLQIEHQKTKEINAKRKLLGLPSLEYENLWYKKRILME